MATEVIQLRTTLSVEQVKKTFSTTLQTSRKVEFGAIRASDNPFEERTDFDAFAELKTFLGGWLVQIYITDRTDVREIQLAALGSTPLGRAWRGLRYTYSLKESRQRVMSVVEQLRSADAGLQIH
ncbi:hypothetical protein ABZ941_10830 [Streptomyces rubiginosohelvolus]|uniref:hypothetical protein n=1 Tax=Streptomyces rubiginosohelvolus TaxID=67362 RepID=UPI0033E5D8F7